MRQRKEIKPYSTKELAFLYEMSTHCFNKMIQPFKEDIGKRSGWYFNVNQVGMIFNKAGYPSGLLKDEYVPSISENNKISDKVA
jgi:hypothetical protein